MTEASLRRRHRTLGIILTLFILVQAATGFLLTAMELAPTPWGLKATGAHELLEALHYEGGGALGNLYRLVLGLGLMGMAVSGSLIYLKIRTRTPRA
jgi:hypothetical protein